MRNFTEAIVITTDEYKGPYATALAKARSLQSKAPEHITYTIDGQEDGEGKVQKHEGKFGGQPPYQAIVHKSGPVSAKA